ncbi:MAG: preprotein translocase subunit SecG [Sphaerochaetaceae bacterium]
MGVLSVVIMVLFVIVSLLLILIVAIQSENGSGLGGIFGGGSDSTFGSQSGRVVTRATAILGATFLVLALVLAMINKTPSGDSLLDTVKVEQVQQSGDWWKVDTAK